MRIAIASLDYYSQNNVADCKKAARSVRANKVTHVGFTEVRTKAMDQGLIAGLAPTMAYIDGGESPQAARKNWVLDRKWKKRLTPGKAGVTPSLYAVVGQYHLRSTPRKKIAIVSTHLVPLTLHGKPRPDSRMRTDMWLKHFHDLEPIKNRLIAAGYTVFIVGDFNNFKADPKIIKQIDPKAKWVIKQGLDWVFVIEGPTKIKSMGPVQSFSTGSDHKAWARTVALR